MKKLPIITAFILTGLTSSSQEYIQKWTPAVKAGIGIGLDNIYLLHGEIGAQLEYRQSEIFSWVGNFDIAGNFDTYYQEYYSTQLSLSAGPRFYIKNTFFIGAGLGYIHTFDGEPYAGMLLNPYLGLNTRKFQFVLDVKATAANAIAESFISLMVAYKFGGNQ